MRRRCLLIAAATVIGSAAQASAEPRTTAVTLGGWAGGISGSGQALTAGTEAEVVAGAYVAATWEPPRLALPDAPGYRFGVAVAPELHVGLLAREQRGDGYLAVGARAELRLAQRAQGLLRVSGRSSFYAALRAGVVGDDRTPLYQLVLGGHASFGEWPLRLGFELGGFGVHAPGDPRGGAMAGVYLGLDLGR